MMDKRYQVFISSTYTDLREERREVFHMLMRMKCIPAGMELFPATDGGPSEYIRREIDESDFYLLIIGGRYGSVSPEGTSYTELEYDYVVAQGKEVIALVHGAPHKLSGEKLEMTEAAQERLKQFRGKVRSKHLCDEWIQAHELPGKVSVNIHHAMGRVPVVGWVRGDRISATESEQVNRLQNENRVLIEENQQLQDENATLQKEIEALKSVPAFVGSTKKSGNEEIKQIVPEEEHLPVMEKDQFGIFSDLEIKTRTQPVIQRFRWVKPGTFMMGSPESEPERNENEVRHQVTLTTGFWLTDTVCTQLLWEAVIGKNPSYFQGENRPVENVSWNEAQEFLKQTSQLNPKHQFCLPTEAQWEYACRAGTMTPFSFGENITIDQVNYGEGQHLGQTVSVKSLPANPWGLYEMHGNVWEWVADKWKEKLAEEPISNPFIIAKPLQEHVIRGGSWFENAKGCRSAFRRANLSRVGLVDLGFRFCRKNT